MVETILADMYRYRVEICEVCLIRRELKVTLEHYCTVDLVELETLLLL